MSHFVSVILLDGVCVVFIPFLILRVSVRCVCFPRATMADPAAGPDRTAPAVTPAVMASLPSLTIDGDDNPRGAYLDSCRDLQSAIGSLESALIAFTGKEEGVKGEVFAKTKARLDRELAQEIAPADS